MAGPSVLVRILGDSGGFTKATNDATASSSKLADAGSKVSSAIGQTLSGAMRLAATAATVAGGALVSFGVDSFKTAARVGEMDATLRALSKGNAEVYQQMTSSVKAIRSQGIEYGVAQNLVAQFSRNQLDLAKSTDLATVAQDAAVISGQNSSETLDQLIHGITTQNSLVLRNAGVNVQAGKAMDDYAKSVGKSAKDLTEAERSQAVLNAVIAAGGPIAGAYASAMEEPGKVLRSFPRIVDDIKVSIGEGLVNAFGPAILKAYDLVKAFSEAIKEGGSLRPVIDALIAKITPLAQKFGEIASKAAEFLKAIPPEMVKNITDKISGLGTSAAGAGTAIGVMGVKNIPILGQLLGGVNPLVAGFAGLILSTKGGQQAMGMLWNAIKPLIPDLLKLVQIVADLAVKALVPLLPPLMKLITIALPPLLAIVIAVAEAIGFWLNVLGPLAPVIVTLGAVLGVLALAVWAVNAAMLANPITLVIIGIIALTAVVILIIKHFDTFKNAAVTAFNAVLSVASSVWNWIKSNWPLLLGILLGPVGIAAALIYTHFDTIKNAAMAVFNWIKSNWPLLVTIILVLLGPIGAVAAAVFTFRDQIASSVSSVIGIFRGLPGQILGALGDLGNLLFDAGKRIITGLIDGVKSMVGAVGDAIGGVASKIKSFLPFSPAKEGPLSGSGDPHNSGAAIVGSLIRGIDSQRAALARSMDSLLTEVSVPSAALGAMSGGASVPITSGAAGPAVVIQNAEFHDEADIEVFTRQLSWIVQTGAI